MEPTGTSEGAGAPHPRRAHKGATAPRGDALRAPRDPPQPRTSPLGEQKGPRPGWTGARRARLARDPPSQPFSARPQGCEAPAGGGAGAVRAGAGAGGSAGTEPPEPASPRRARGGERGKGRGQSAPSRPHPVGGSPLPAPQGPVPGCGPKGAGAAPPPCPAPAAGGPDGSGSVRPGRHVSRAARCIVGQGGRESPGGGRLAPARLPLARPGCPWPVWALFVPARLASASLSPSGLPRGSLGLGERPPCRLPPAFPRCCSRGLRDSAAPFFPLIFFPFFFPHKP